MQNDEAVSGFDAVVDQMTVGHRWLQENLNATTDIGWQLDPFGNMAATARLFAQMGFKYQLRERVADCVRACAGLRLRFQVTLPRSVWLCAQRD